MGRTCHVLPIVFILRSIVLHDESSRSDSIAGKLILVDRLDEILPLQEHPGRFESRHPGSLHSVRNGQSLRSVTQPHANKVATGIMGILVRVAGVEESKVVDEDHVSGLGIEGKLVPGSDLHQDTQSLDLRRL